MKTSSSSTFCVRRALFNVQCSRFEVVLLLASLLVSAGAAAAAPLRILMLGNSYTDVNLYDYNVWQQLQNFLDADPDCAATVSRRAPGAWKLYQHANDATSTNLLASQGPWDYVILQDQSYTPSHGWLYGGTNWATFTNGIYPLTRMAKSQGTKVIYYQTWARGAGEPGVLATNYNGSPEFMQDNISAAYGYAATYHGVKVAPVGEAWEKSLALNPKLILHSPDLSHMNPRGAYLAGATLYRTITGKDPALVGYTSTLPVAEANTLRANLAALPPQPNLAIDPVIPDGQVFRIPARAAPGTALGTVQAIAYQPPPGSNAEDPYPRIVCYEITAGNTNEQFALNSTNGVLALVGSPVAGTNTLTVRVTDSNNWQTNNTIEVQVWTHGWFTAVHYRTNGHVQLLFVAGLGAAYGVEASTNLVDWEMIGAAVDHGDSTFEFNDPDAAKFTKRFYRVVSP